MPNPRLKRSDTSLIIAARDPAQANLIRALAIASGAHAYVASPDAGLEDELTRLRYAHHERSVLVADVATLAAQGEGPGTVIQRLQASQPALGIVALADECLQLSAAQEILLKQHGALGAFPALSRHRMKETLLPVQACVLGVPVTDLDPADLEPYLKVIAQDHELSGALDDAQLALAKLPGRGFTLKTLLDELKGPRGFNVADRSFRLKSYPECLVASEGVDALCAITGASRGSAVALGQALQHLGYLHHVAGDHVFADEDLFFRFSPPTENTERADLAALLDAARGEAGFPVKDRTYLGKRYPACFTGSEAAVWLRKHGRLNRCEALRVGQSLLALHAFHHVTHDHPFADWEYFYRFT
ncbi:MAG: hypothetical protein JNM76_15085 [Betaproteobacteria bacterium]|nr:hypothetical protein [Betaproteobacteria bacterium]